MPVCFCNEENVDNSEFALISLLNIETYSTIYLINELIGCCGMICDKYISYFALEYVDFLRIQNLLARTDT